jgi:tRNA pseudouridine65 synthase
MTAPPSIPILYRDRHYIAVHKPPGLLVHRSPISRDERFLLQTLRDQVGQRLYPIHRLDRATSGVVVFGLDGESAGRLAGEFEQRRVAKQYLALVRGWLEDAGTIDHPVTDEEGSNRPQPALTRYRCLARCELPVAVDRYPSSRYSLVSVTPETGRRQQIRKHFKHISHHLIGDTSHGSGRHNAFFRERFAIHRLMLLAQTLGFVHPYTGEPMRLAAEPEPDWTRVAAGLGWSPECLQPDPDAPERLGEPPGRPAR